MLERKRALSIFTVAAALACLGGLPARAKAQVPNIVFYQASPTTIDTIQAVRLWWKVEGAARVDVLDGWRNVTIPQLGFEAYIEVWPERTSTYTLVATGPTGATASSAITIYVSEPQILSFTALPYETHSLQAVRLSWATRGARQVDIYDGRLNTTYSNLGAQNEIEVWPERTTTYTLYLHGLDGSVLTQFLTVWVHRDDLQPIIHEFGAGPSPVEPHQTVTLWWNVEHVVRVEIYDNRELVYAQSIGSGNTTLEPRRTTTYTLYAYGEEGQPAVRQVTVFVNRHGG